MRIDSSVSFCSVHCTTPEAPRKKADSVSTLPVESQEFVEAYSGLKFGDLDNDGRVTLSDFSLLASKIGTNAKDADINRDGLVDTSDFNIQRGYFGMDVSKKSQFTSNKSVGDFNSDNSVNISDFAIFAANIGGKDLNYDINEDSVVDDRDFSIFSGYFGRDISNLLDSKPIQPVATVNKQVVIDLPSQVSADYQAEKEVEAKTVTVGVPQKEDSGFHLRSLRPVEHYHEKKIEVESKGELMSAVHSRSWHSKRVAQYALLDGLFKS